MKLEVLNKYIARIEAKIKNKVNILATTKETSTYFYTKMQVELKQYYEELRQVFIKYLNQEIPASYKESLIKNITKIKGLKFQGNRQLNLMEYKKSNLHKQTVNAILKDGIGNFMTALQTGNKSLLRLVNATQQYLLKEKQVNKLVSDGLADKGTIPAASKKLRDQLQKFLDDKYITIINKNGDEMSFGIKYYSDLVAQNKILEAKNTATINTALEVGSDLVQMDNHNSDCPICAPLEGKIYSISGNDPDFPVLDFSIPLHPNCYHGLSVVFRETLEHRGIQQYIDFSNGDSNSMPYNSSYKPLDERNLA